MIISFKEWIENLREGHNFSLSLVEVENFISFCEKKCKRALSDSEVEKLSKSFGNFKKKFGIYWKQCNRSWPKLVNRHPSILEASFELSDARQSSVKKRGRPGKSFDEKSGRSQRRQVQHMMNRNEYSPELYIRAAIRASKNDELSKALKVILENRNDVQFLRKISKPPKCDVKISVETSSAMLLHADISVNSYNIIRDTATVNGVKIFPPYARVAEHRLTCRPKSIQVTASCANVPWRPLIEHTLKEIVSMCEKDIEQEFGNFQGIIDMQFLGNYGFDGSSNYATYQHSSGLDLGNSLFCTHMTPLRLKASNGKTFWLNDCPSSVYSVRPKKYEFKKETKEHVKKEYLANKEELEELEIDPILIPLDSGNNAF